MTRSSAAPRWAVVLLGVLPWAHPWAPGPEANTVPLLIGWAVAALWVLARRWPTASEWARIWVLAAAVNCAVGLLQYAGLAGQLGPLSALMHVPDHMGEAMGNLRQRNQLATLTSMGVVALLWWRTHGLARGWAVLGMVLLACGNAATGSRTGLVQWLALPVLLALWQWASGVRVGVWRLLLAGVGVYVLASWALPLALQAWQHSAAIGGSGSGSGMARLGADDGCGSRLLLWGNVLELVAQRPWAGWGWGQAKYAHYMNDFAGARFCGVLGNAHNLPLQLALVAGWPAALALAVAVAVALWRGRAWRADTPVQRLGWGVWAMVALHSLLEFPLWYSPFQLAVLGASLLLWPAAGRWLAALPGPLVAAVAAAALVLMAWVAADHARMRQVFVPAAQRLSVWSEDPWRAAQASVFFKPAVAFATLTTTPVTAANAEAMYAASTEVLRYSPEPAVVAKLIASARLTGREEVALWHEAQLQKVHPAR